MDTSDEGHQPMRSPSGRFVAVYNGEVYNHEELRRELARSGNVRFRGHSDTEVVLACFDRWGVSESLERFVGMFAMAVWDRRERQLLLIRDRLGIKPLYVYQKDGLLLFGSELKALLRHPGFDRRLDRRAVEQYFRCLYVPTPRSIFAHARKLPPGCYLTVTDPARPLGEPTPYWSLTTISQEGISDPVPDSAGLVDDVEDRLREAVRLRMRADVPLGVLLSGGIDSTLVTALAQEAANKPIPTFCVGFEDGDHDESDHASALAETIGTDHTTVVLSGKDALSTIPDIDGIFDEPFGNPSHIPTLLVSRVARKHVTVALSGDGGDEVFAGYNRYLYGRNIIPSALKYPRPLRRAASSALAGISAAGWDRAYGMVGTVLPGRRERLVGQKVQKLAKLLDRGTDEEMYRSLLSTWEGDGNGDRLPASDTDSVSKAFRAHPKHDLLARMQLADQLGYLHDDLLTKVDRVSMAASLEVRVPLLDHRLVEFSWRIPESAKIRDGAGKWLLRQVLYRRVPRHLVDRPKTGFTVPLESWLRGPLREWAESLLDPTRLREIPGVDGDAIRRTWTSFLSGRGEHSLQVWSVLMFESWRSRWA